ncbi:MAG: PAS domain-containing protein [Candidatus Sericytochromatia bacterium]|nr:PAS domain-containing protein [Candidatus Tanganyikabacteria bacterium]
MAATVGLPPDVPRLIDRALAGSEREMLVATVQRTCQPVYLPDWRAPELEPRLTAWWELLEGLAVRAIANLPLKFQGRSVGVLSLAFPEPTEFGASLQDALELIANHLAANVGAALDRQALRRDRAFQDRLIAHAPWAIAYIDRDRVYRLVNDAWCSLSGLSREEAVGRSYAELFPEPNPRLEAVFEFGRTVTVTGLPMYPDPDDPGRLRHWDATYCPVPGEAGEIAGVLVMGAETTDRQRLLEAERERAEAAESASAFKDGFLAILSHELRTPLNAITGFGSLLLDGTPAEPLPEQVPYLERVLQGADHLVSLIDQLLDASRIQAGQLRVHLREFDVATVIRTTCSQAASRFADAQVTLIVDVPDDLPPLLADDHRIAQVVDNLLSNAAKFTPPGGTVTVLARADGGHFLCEVADTGSGIPEERLETVFDLFVQLDMSSTRVHGGLGLGLAIMRALVEAHGGEVGVRSHLGSGSAFWFTLPVGVTPASELADQVSR